jgi:hypothetical protein
MSASNELQNSTSTINEMWRTVFNYIPQDLFLGGALPEAERLFEAAKVAIAHARFCSANRSS